ncbi:MAG: hypothetical protein ACRC5A_04390 [Enterobacteriaceae bacterium]
MSIPYRVVERPNPQNRDQKRWYAQPRVFRKISATDLCKSACYGRSVVPSEIVAALEVMIHKSVERLTAGDSVTFPGLGSFRVSLSGIGADTEDEFHEGLIRNAKIIFTPSVDLKKVIADVSFERCSLEPAKRKTSGGVDPDPTPGA